MARTGRIVREIDVQERPETQIVSVPDFDRPSEKHARRRKLWEGPMPDPQPERVEEPVKEPAHYVR